MRNSAFRLRTLASAAALALAACQSTPTTPPALDLPQATLAHLDLERWWMSFDDTMLNALVDEALANNLDLQAAIARIELAQANLLLARSFQFPNMTLGVDAGRSRTSQATSQQNSGGFGAVSNNYAVGLNASYEIDLWGKYRSGTAAARQQLLASEYARQTVRIAVAAETARAYFGLLAADAELVLLRDTLKSREETVALQQDLYDSGIIGEYDLRRAEAERSAVAADIPVAERFVGNYESAVAALTGRSPRAVFTPEVARDVARVRLLGVPPVPAGLPSGMLERRPDVRQSEAQIAAAALRIDAARADYFPSISLTGGYGVESAALSNLFTGPALAWAFGAALTQQVLGFKAIEANVQAQVARRDAAIVEYRQTVQAAFRETHDALVANRTTREALAAQSERARKLEESLEFADVRYRAGYSPYLEVLDAQRLLLRAQTLEILTARDVRFALIDLAKAMGGGWDYKADLAAK